MKYMKFPMDSSSVTQSFFPLIVISSLTRVCRPMKVEKLWREAFRSLCSRLSLMNIVCLNMTFVWTYQMSWMGSLIMPMPVFQSSFVASIALPILLLLRYIQTPIQIQIRFQYRSSMLLVL